MAFNLSKLAVKNVGQVGRSQQELEQAQGGPASGDLRGLYSELSFEAAPPPNPAVNDLEVIKAALAGQSLDDIVQSVSYSASAIAQKSLQIAEQIGIDDPSMILELMNEQRIASEQYLEGDPHSEEVKKHEHAHALGITMTEDQVVDQLAQSINLPSNIDPENRRAIASYLNRIYESTWKDLYPSDEYDSERGARAYSGETLRKANEYLPQVLASMQAQIQSQDQNGEAKEVPVEPDENVDQPGEDLEEVPEEEIEDILPEKLKGLNNGVST